MDCPKDGVIFDIVMVEKNLESGELFGCIPHEARALAESQTVYYGGKLQMEILWQMM